MLSEAIRDREDRRLGRYYSWLELCLGEEVVPEGKECGGTGHDLSSEHLRKAVGAILPQGLRHYDGGRAYVAFKQRNLLFELDAV